VLESVRREIEQEVAKRETGLLDTLIFNRINTGIYYLAIVLSASASLILLLGAAVIGSHHPGIGHLANGVAVLLSGALIMIVEYFRTSKRTWQVAARVKRAIDSRRQRRVDDFLQPYYWSTLGFVIGPVIGLLAIAAFLDSPWLSAGDPHFAKEAAPIERALTFAGLLVAGQITLFTFLFGHSLGKYSSKLARVIMEHPAVRTLQVCGMVGLLFPVAIMFTGLPVVMVRNFWLFHASLFFCLVLTVLVARRGVDSDALIVFAGQHYAKRLRSIIRSPVAGADGQMPAFWVAASRLGLDLRNPERFVLHAEPRRGASLCKTYLMSFFNAASEAIISNQQESLRACLQAIAAIMSTYSAQRRGYQCSTDSVYSYCNDHFAALVGLAQKSSNEHMATDIVIHIGAVAATGLRIRGTPSSIDESLEIKRQRDDHSIAGLWVGLLRECFRRTHKLQRTPAPSEVIAQLKIFALRVDKEGYPATVHFSFLPAFEEILDTCLTNGDAYHLSLVSECMAGLMQIWAFHLTQPSYLSGHGQLHQEISELIVGSVRKGAGAGLPNLVTRAVPETLAYKCASDAVTFQDIFWLTMHRKVPDLQHQRDCVSGLIIVIDSLADLVVEQIKLKGHGTKYYLDALFEVSYLVLAKLPDTFLPMSDPAIEGAPPQVRRLMRARREAPREKLEKALFGAWERTIPWCYQGAYHRVYEWEQSLLGFIGMSICRMRERNDQWLREGIEQCSAAFVKQFEKELEEPEHRLRSGSPEYLQLLAAWLSACMPQSSLNRELLRTLAILHLSFDYHFSRSGGPYSCLGYPGMSGSDSFYFPPLRSIHGMIDQQDWDRMKECEASLMSPDVLHDYYSRVQTERLSILRAKGSFEGEEQLKRLIALLKRTIERRTP